MLWLFGDEVKRRIVLVVPNLGISLGVEEADFCLIGSLIAAARSKAITAIITRLKPVSLTLPNRDISRWSAGSEFRVSFGRYRTADLSSTILPMFGYSRSSVKVEYWNRSLIPVKEDCRLSRVLEPLLRASTMVSSWSFLGIFAEFAAMPSHLA